MIMKYYYACFGGKLESVTTVYDTHREYDIELKSLITSGRD